MDRKRDAVLNLLNSALVVSNVKWDYFYPILQVILKIFDLEGEDEGGYRFPEKSKMVLVESVHLLFQNFNEESRDRFGSDQYLPVLGFIDTLFLCIYVLFQFSYFQDAHACSF